MMKRQRVVLAIGALLLALPGRVLAQQDKYELGRRLGSFELTWEKQTDTQARRKALAVLQPLPLKMLVGQLDEAGRAFDEARHALNPAQPVTPEMLWAESLGVRLATRLIDAGQTELPFSVQHVYQPKAPPVAGATLQLRLLAGLAILGGKAFEVPLTQVPLQGKLPLNGTGEGDHGLHIVIRNGDRVAAQTLFRVSVVKDLKPRLEKLTTAVAGFGPKVGNVDRDSVRATVQLLVGLANGETREIDYPAARLLAEAEAAVAAIKAGQSYYGGTQVGQFWLRLPNGRGAVPVRLLAPPAVKEKKPLPLVIAMHDLGTTENMFFEAYGSGQIVKLCQERGWLLVAPRGQLIGNYSVPEVIDEVAKLYPVDRTKVFLVGHALGAHQALTAAMQNPNLYAGVAGLGGGLVKVTPNARKVPFFIGIGTSDLALIVSRGVRDRLVKAGFSRVNYREYPGFENYVIVREALPDAFGMFDKIHREGS